jgi:thymidylate kinase
VLQDLRGGEAVTGAAAIHVVFEGADVVGKTEQQRLLAGRMVREGISVVETSFPSDGLVGKALRRHLRGEIVVADVEAAEKTGNLMTSMEDALFFEALNCLDKMVVAADVRQYLREGTSVVSSRWTQTALVYGKDAGVDGACLRKAYSQMPQADVNFLLYARPVTCLARRGTDRDRYERDIDKQVRIAEEYHRMWRAPGYAGEGWCIVLDGEEPAEKVHERVWDHLLGHSKMQGLLSASKVGLLAAEGRLERLRQLVQRPGCTLQMSKSDADEFARLLFASPRGGSGEGGS